MRRMLLGQDSNAACVWTACDPYTTQAVRGVEGHGQRSNCGRTNKDGIDFVKGNKPGYERYLALYATPQEVGGCQDCRFFLMCKGQCPGTAIDGDWRNRTEHCEVWKAVYGLLETELVAEGKNPLSLRLSGRESSSGFSNGGPMEGRFLCLTGAVGRRSTPTEVAHVDWRLTRLDCISGFQEILCERFTRRDGPPPFRVTRFHSLLVGWRRSSADVGAQTRPDSSRWSDVEWLSIVDNVRPLRIGWALAAHAVVRSSPVVCH